MCGICGFAGFKDDGLLKEICENPVAVLDAGTKRRGVPVFGGSHEFGAVYFLELHRELEADRVSELEKRRSQLLVLGRGRPRISGKGLGKVSLEILDKLPALGIYKREYGYVYPQVSQAVRLRVDITEVCEQAEEHEQHNGKIALEDVIADAHDEPAYLAVFDSIELGPKLYLPHGVEKPVRDYFAADEIPHVDVKRIGKIIASQKRTENTADVHKAGKQQEEAVVRRCLFEARFPDLGAIEVVEKIGLNVTLKLENVSPTRFHYLPEEVHYSVYVDEDYLKLFAEI